MKISRILSITLVTVVLLAGTTAMAGPFDVLVGDKDGYGTVGCSDTAAPGTCVWPAIPGYDGRDAAEMAATNGAQITDVYSAIFPGSGPNPSTTASVIFPSVGTITSATLTVAMGDFQASTFGPITVTFNGVSESWAFDDGFEATAIHSFVLSPAEIAAANLAGHFQIDLDHGTSGDYIAFDWFELSGNSTRTVPEPATLLLLGSGLVGLAGLAWRKN